MSKGCKSLEGSGVGDGNRTHNHRIHNPVLCLLSYTHLNWTPYSNMKPPESSTIARSSETAFPAAQGGAAGAALEGGGSGGVDRIGEISPGPAQLESPAAPDPGIQSLASAGLVPRRRSPGTVNTNLQDGKISSHHEYISS